MKWLSFLSSVFFNFFLSGLLYMSGLNLKQIIFWVIMIVGNILAILYGKFFSEANL